MAQRKFLRQVSSYVKNSDPYPRLFVADLNYDPTEVQEEVNFLIHGQVNALVLIYKLQTDHKLLYRRGQQFTNHMCYVQGEAALEDTDLILDEDMGQKVSFVVDDLRSGQFCIKALCEYEGVSKYPFFIVGEE